MSVCMRTFLSSGSEAILVEVTETRGSTPREAGAFMLVSADSLWGTIGGGQLEFMAIERARRLLSGADATPRMDVPLGPEIGQCCGGRAMLSFRNIDDFVRADLLERLESGKAVQPDIYLFGAGHVGLALATALAPLPFNVTIIETREIDHADVPPAVTLRQVAMPEAEIGAIRPGGAVLILTHDHALDFLIAKEALARTDLSYVGMIGSATKRATFRHWLEREGGTAEQFARLTLPIGGSDLRDKRPPVIAALVAAELCRLLLAG